eukprot:GGOE01061426.1.p3 GENE.GGOE01061426.1~~GGOE01061426.1.p3  ORF type:complete len:227 (+),score=78.72 GGOE01061426.1:1097-1777(+)
MLLFDPTFWFVVGCLLTPLGLVLLEQPKDALQQVLTYVTDPALLCGFAAFLFGLLGSAGGRGVRNRTEELVANWFLMNGAFIHIAMDGLTGGYHLLPLMYQNYVKVDRRFQTDELNSWVITQVELFLQGPFCILTYIAYQRQWAGRYPLAAMTTTLQWFGAVIFAVVEWLADFPNVPVDRKFEFTPDHCLYFWFGYGANLIWLTVPVLIVWHTVSAIGSLVKAKAM